MTLNLRTPTAELGHPMDEAPYSRIGKPDLRSSYLLNIYSGPRPNETW